jgi:hypothetical protein
MSIKITCINKVSGLHNDVHESISHLGWVNEITQKTGKYTRSEIIDFIEKGNIAYTKDQHGNIAYLVVKTSSSGNMYVQTIADGKETDNLLYLPECP